VSGVGCPFYRSWKTANICVYLASLVSYPIPQYLTENALCSRVPPQVSRTSCLSRWKNGIRQTNWYYHFSNSRQIASGAIRNNMCVGGKKAPGSIWSEAPKNTVMAMNLDRKKPPPGGVFPIYYIPSSRTVCKRTPLVGFVPGSSRGVLLHTVLDEGT